MAVLLQWSEALMVGHPIIDYDHQMLVNIANDLHHAVKFEQGDEEVERALARLVQYVETHFKREEALFMDSHYPNKQKHLQNHRDIEKLVHGFLNSFHADPSGVDMEKLLVFLREWLIKHIGKLDKGYMPYVKSAQKHQGSYNSRTGFA